MNKLATYHRVTVEEIESIYNEFSKGKPFASEKAIVTSEIKEGKKYNLYDFFIWYNEELSNKPITSKKEEKKYDGGKQEISEDEIYG